LPLSITAHPIIKELYQYFFKKTSAQQTVYFKHRPIYRIGNAINIHRAITFFPPETDGRFYLARPAPLNAIAYLTGVGQTKSSVLALWNVRHISSGCICACPMEFSEGTLFHHEMFTP